MEKELLIEQTISDLYKLSTNNLIQIQNIIENIKSNLSKENEINELSFNWGSELSNEKISSVKLQKEALNWR